MSSHIKADCHPVSSLVNISLFTFQVLLCPLPKRSGCWVCVKQWTLLSFLLPSSIKSEEGTMSQWVLKTRDAWKWGQFIHNWNLGYWLWEFNYQSTPLTISGEESFLGITLMGLACRHVCGALSGLLLEVGAPILGVGGTISRARPFTLEEWRKLTDFNQQTSECLLLTVDVIDQMLDFPEMVQWNLES